MTQHTYISISLPFISTFAGVFLAMLVTQYNDDQKEKDFFLDSLRLMKEDCYTAIQSNFKLYKIMEGFQKETGDMEIHHIEKLPTGMFNPTTAISFVAASTTNLTYFEHETTPLLFPALYSLNLYSSELSTHLSSLHTISGYYNTKVGEGVMFESHQLEKAVESSIPILYGKLDRFYKGLIQFCSPIIYEHELKSDAITRERFLEKLNESQNSGVLIE